MSDPTLSTSGLTVGRIAELACLLEVSASKPGNVHRGADFQDVTFLDFAMSAVAMGQAIDDAADRPYGDTVLGVAKRTRQVTNSNTNLGINLLISLLAKPCPHGDLTSKNVQSALGDLDEQDAAKVFEAIRLMNPGGLGEADSDDVNDGDPTCLIVAMKKAQDRDRVAAQFTNGFADVFQKALPWILEGREKFGDLMQGIVWAHVRLMAEYPDSLIARKCGLAIAEQSQTMARKAIDALADGLESFFSQVSNLDFWLRSDGHRRNPGTTADLIAAGLFVGLYNGDIRFPVTSSVNPLADWR